jgi:hypothetical protein
MRAVAQPATTARDVKVLLVGTLFAIGWDLSGGDLAVTRLFGQANGFAWRDAFVTAQVLHEGGRWMGWIIVCGWVLYALRPAWALHSASAPAGWWWL